MFQGSLNGVSRKLQECFKEGFRDISRVFQESSKGVSSTGSFRIKVIFNFNYYIFPKILLKAYFGEMIFSSV